MTFLTDLDNLIKNKHGDVKKLREIRDTIRHDNFITTEDKNYVEALINERLTAQALNKVSSRKQTNAKIKLQTKANDSDSQSNFTFNFSSNKKLGVLGGAAAVIAIIVIVSFTGMDASNSIGSSTQTNPLLLSVDQSKYQRADIISISGNTISNSDTITLSIENAKGAKVWKEVINPKNDGGFSTLLIAGGGGWDNGGSYTLNAVQNDLTKKIKFQFVL